MGQRNAYFVVPQFPKPISRKAAESGQLGERLAAVVVEKNGQKDYRTVEAVDEEAFAAARSKSPEIPLSRYRTGNKLSDGVVNGGFS